MVICTTFCASFNRCAKLIFEQAKRISLMVTTDSVCDLPEALKKESVNDKSGGDIAPEPINHLHNLIL